jgi:hypothetical protein
MITSLLPKKFVNKNLACITGKIMIENCYPIKEEITDEG